MAAPIKPINANRSSRLDKRNGEVFNDLESKHRCHGLGRKSMSLKAALMDELDLSAEDEIDIPTSSDVEQKSGTEH